MNVHSFKFDVTSYLNECTYKLSTYVCTCTYINIHMCMNYTRQIRCDSIQHSAWLYAMICYICVCECSLPFTGPFAGLKLAGVSPANCPTESPAKKIAPQKSKLGLPNSSQHAPAIFARPYYDRNTLFRCY